MKETLHTYKKCFFITTVVFALSISCNKEDAPDCFQSAGDLQTERREISPFDLIEIHDYIELELYDTTVYFVEIHAPKNLIPDITTNNKDGKLEIRNDNTCNWVRSFQNKITVRIYAPEFREVENFGTGDIVSINKLTEQRLKIENRHSAGTIRLNVELDTLSLYMHTGVSDAILSGTAETIELFNQGLGLIDARNLKSQYAFCNNSSINDLFVWSEQYLYAFIQFTGNIIYKGNPTHMDVDIRGNGQLLKLE